MFRLTAHTGNQALAAVGCPDESRSKSFEPKTLIENRKRAAGIEPASSAWKAEVLPLNYARIRWKHTLQSLRPFNGARGRPGLCSGLPGVASGE
jgi:hypothetical protein